MSYEFYKVLHIIGIVWLFASLGAQVLWGLNGGTRDDHPDRRLVMMSHGVALLLVFVAGFGMQAKAHLGWPGWFFGKLTIWLILGGVVTLPLRKPELARPMWFALPILGALAAWLVVYKPF